MNRKQLRDSLRAHRTKPHTETLLRKVVFGFYGRDLTAYFTEKRRERMGVTQ